MGGATMTYNNKPTWIAYRYVHTDCSKRSAITCVDRVTLERATSEPQKFDLIRDRMGGWSNFYVSMFESHQKQHQRRHYFKAHEKN